jgi:hypothetical protein
MAVTLTYDATLSRVRVDATSLGTASTALVERSTDEIRWTTVRGGTAAVITGGVMATVDDYEFAANVENFYRVRYFAEPSFVSVGTAATGNNTSVAPGLPAGHAAGTDTLVLYAAIRNLGVGTVDTPAGWTELVSMSGNVKLFGKVSVGGAEVGPTVTFTGGAAGSDTAAQICALRNVDMTTLIAASAAAASQDIVTPIFDLGSTWRGAEVLYLGWKADDWTSVALAQGTEIAEFVSTAGSDMGMVWNHRHIAETVLFDELGTQTFTVTGGGVATGQGGVVAMEPATLTQSNSITPTLDGVWFKFLARPFLNTPVDVYGDVNVTRRARNAVFDVVGRTVPVAVTDVRSGREFPLSVKTMTSESHSRLDFAVLGGDPVFVHAPPGTPVPTMYAVIGDTSDDQPVPGTHLWTLPLTEVAAPAPEIVGATITYQGVVNAYASYQAVLDDEASYADLLTLIGDPADIITD